PLPIIFPSKESDTASINAWDPVLVDPRRTTAICDMVYTPASGKKMVSFISPIYIPAPMSHLEDSTPFGCAANRYRLLLPAIWVIVNESSTLEFDNPFLPLKSSFWHAYNIVD